MCSAPKDETEIIILFDSAGVPIVRLCWWNDGIGDDFKPDHDFRGWWSYNNSVSQEMIDESFMRPVGWMPMPSNSSGE
jgi:hypothetical protein